MGGKSSKNRGKGQPQNSTPVKLVHSGHGHGVWDDHIESTRFAGNHKTTYTQVAPQLEPHKPPTVITDTHKWLPDRENCILSISNQGQEYTIEGSKPSDRSDSKYVKEAKVTKHAGRGVNSNEDNRKLIEQLQNELKQLRTRLKQQEDECRILTDELNKCKTERDDYRDRLSLFTAIKLTDNNPNIADLSDLNRPTKLAERFSELYDNQWSDAFEELTENGMNEKQATKRLLEILRTILDTCEGKNHGELRHLEDRICSYICSGEMPEYLLTHMKLYKEERKKHCEELFAGTREEVMRALTQKGYNTDGEHLASYIEEATDVCWLMCIQDPPMALDFDCKHGDTFDTELYKAYTKAGRVVSFLVWPALRQCRGGPVISKGVAQGTKKQRTSKSMSSDSERGGNKRSRHSSLNVEERGSRNLNDSSVTSKNLKVSDLEEDPSQSVQENPATKEVPSSRIVNPDRMSRKRNSYSNLQAGNPSPRDALETNSLDESRHSQHFQVQERTQAIYEKFPLNSNSWTGSTDKGTQRVSQSDHKYFSV